MYYVLYLAGRRHHPCLYIVSFLKSTLLEANIFQATLFEVILFEGYMMFEAILLKDNSLQVISLEVALCKAN